MFCMDLESGEPGGHIVVALRGELDLVDAADVTAALVGVTGLEPRIIVDLSGLGFIDANGVAALSRGRRQARNAGGYLLLAAPQPQVQRVLAIIWDADGTGVHASVAEAAACAGSLLAGAPLRAIRRQSASSSHRPSGEIPRTSALSWSRWC